MIRFLCGALLALGSISSAQTQSPYVNPYQSPFVNPFVGDAEHARLSYGKTYGGNDYDAIAHAATAGAFDFGTASYSIGLYYKPASVTGARGLLGKGDVDTGTGTWGLWTDEANVRANIDDGVAAKGAGNTTTLSIGTWYYIELLIDRDADEMRLYVDNVLAGAGSTVDIAGFGTQTNSNDVLLGRFLYGGAFYYSQGTLTSIRFVKGSATRLYATRTDPFGACSTGWAFQPGKGALITSYNGGPPWTSAGGAATSAWTVHDNARPPTRF